MRSILLLALWPLPVLAQDAVVVEASASVPVPLEGLAERLRAELPAIPVQVGAAATDASGAAATVTLALTQGGQVQVVYRDAAGREASRIVADTTDPQAVAAAVAMIVANLHRSQMDLALAAIGPAPTPPPGPPPIVEVPPRVTVRARPLAARATVERRREESWAIWAAPALDMMSEPILGVESGAEIRVGDYRLELALHHAPDANRDTSTRDFGYLEATYSHTLTTARVRRLFRFGRNVTIGAAGGLGFIISTQENAWAEEPSGFDPEVVAFTGAELDDRRDLDLAIVGGASLDVRVIGPVFWTTRLESVFTTAAKTAHKPFAPGVFGHLGTGLRLAL
jgi:hypothetical protein